MSSVDSSICRFQQLANCIAEIGDCGSWVLDREGVWYGCIVAIQFESRQALFVPAASLVADIQKKLDSDVSLSPSGAQNFGKAPQQGYITQGMAEDADVFSMLELSPDMSGLNTHVPDDRKLL